MAKKQWKNVTAQYLFFIK